MATQTDLPTAASLDQPVPPPSASPLEAEISGLHALQAKGDHVGAAAGACIGPTVR